MRGRWKLGGVLALMMACGFARICADPTPPCRDGSTATPESQGFSGSRLNALRDELARRHTKAFLVVRNDQVVMEWYAPGLDASRTHGSASLAKALIGGMALAIALDDGLLALDDPAAKFVPAWREKPDRSAIRLRHLGSHTSGLADAEAPSVRHEDLPGWMGQFWKRLAPPLDPFTLARDRAPILFAPGEKIQYSNPGFAMLGYCTTAALSAKQPTDLRAALRDRLFRPLGIADRDWSCGYGQTTSVDGLSLVAAWGGATFTPRAIARIGQLLLHQGTWNGRVLLHAKAVQNVLGDAGLPGHCAMGFWTNADGRYAALPRDTVYGAGAGDQLLVLVPSLNLVMVRLGATLAPAPAQPRDVFEAYHDQRVKILFEPLLEALTDRPRAHPGPAPG